MSKVMLIVIPGYNVPHAQFNLERLGLCYMASSLRYAGHDVKLLDGIVDRLNWHEIIEKTIEYNPEVVGISLMSHMDLTQVQNYVETLHKGLPQSHICIGGTFPSLNWRQVLTKFKYVESVVCGDGEQAIVKIVESLEAGTRLTDIPGVATRHNGIPQITPAKTIRNIDSILPPSRDELPAVLASGGPAAILSSRGCYGRCKFCALQAINRKHGMGPARFRSPIGVVDEIQSIHNEFHARKFYFLDENFIGSGLRGRQRAHEIADEIIRRKLDISFSLECRCSDVESATFHDLVKAGLQRVFLGVESIDADELEKLQKDQDPDVIQHAIDILNGLGVHVEIGFMLFTPWSTMESLSRKRQFLETFGSHATASLGSYLSVPPGTELWHDLRLQGLLKGEWPLYRFEFQDRRSSILFGLIQRHMVHPWMGAIERLMTHQWVQDRDWSIEHALRRTGDQALVFLNELMEWTAFERFKIFDSLYELVSSLSLPKEVEMPSKRALHRLEEISEQSNRCAEEVAALLKELERTRSGMKQVFPTAC